jgi:peptidoglycan/LPS O-acetylase OafA/YrhL
MRESVPSLTGLRFVAALCVLVAHALPKIVPLPEGHEAPVLYALLGSIAGEGMSLFFVLSGFVIHYNYCDQVQNDGGRGIFNFFVARFARLYPLFLFCLTFDLLLRYSYSQIPPSLSAALPYYLSLTQSWVYMPFGDNALIYQFGLMPSVAWSISTEWFFYCIYPFICYGLVRMTGTKQKLLAAVVVAVAGTCLVVAIGSYGSPINRFAVDHFGEVADATSHWQDSFLRWLIYFSPYSRVFEFLLGCLCASIYVARSKHLPTEREKSWGLVALLAAIIGIGALHVFYFAPAVLPPVLGMAATRLHWLNLSFGFAPMMAIVIFCCARYKGTLASWLSSKPIILCGEASYSIYFLHLPVIFAFRWEAAPVTSARVLVGDGLRFGLTVLSVIGLSLVVWALIERPARRWLRHLMIAAPSAHPVRERTRSLPAAQSR